MHYIWQGICRFIIVIAITIAALFASAASAQTVVLRVDGPDGSAVGDLIPPDGSDWGAAAYEFLQEALDEAFANAGESTPYEIWVRGDTSDPVTFVYRPDLGDNHTEDDRYETFDMAANVKVYGGFSNTMTAATQRNPTAYVTVLTGEIGDDERLTDNSIHIVRNLDSSSNNDNCWLDGFTITAGRAVDDDPSPPHDPIGFGGAAIKIETGADMRIHRCIVTGNTSGNGGNGAGIFIDGGNAVITACTITYNGNEEGTLLFGGGIGVDNAYGGLEDPTQIIDCILQSCTAARGGGVWLHDSYAKIVDCLFAFNAVDPVGGGNQGPWGAGLMVDRTSQAKCYNCTWSQNSAVHGGAIAIAGTSLNSYLYNSIAWNDEGTTDADEIYLADNFSGTLYATDTDIMDWDSDSGVKVDGGAISYSGTHKGDDAGDDPLFVGGGDYRLQCGSPAINTGGTTLANIPVDGFDVDLDEDDSERIDLNLQMRIIVRVVLGVYEKGWEPCLADVDGDGNVDIDDYLAVIASWGTCGPPCPADVAPGGPCAIEPDGVVNTLDLLAVLGSWGQCSEQYGPMGDDSETLAACQACLQAALALNLTGEEFLAYLHDCLVEAGVIDP